MCRSSLEASRDTNRKMELKYNFHILFQSSCSHYTEGTAGSISFLSLCNILPSHIDGLPIRHV